MADEIFSPQLPESGAPQGLWSSLSRFWAAAPQSTVDAELGYESAQPWALGEDAPSDSAVWRN